MPSVLGDKLRLLLGASETVKLADGTTVEVRPFTLEEYAEMDRLEPNDLDALGFVRLKLFIIMRAVPGFETPDYATWKHVCTGALVMKLRDVVRAMGRVNASFRYREPGWDASELDASQPRGERHSTVGDSSLDARAVERAQ